MNTHVRFSFMNCVQFIPFAVTHKIICNIGPAFIRETKISCAFASLIMNSSYPVSVASGFTFAPFIISYSSLAKSVTYREFAYIPITFFQFRKLYLNSGHFKSHDRKTHFKKIPIIYFVIFPIIGSDLAHNL